LSSYRRGLTDHVAAGGRLLIEGGELAYDAVSSPGYPDFADSVLHTDDWNGDDVGTLGLDAGYATHPVATEPNSLPATIGIDYAGWGSEDAAHPTGGAYRIYGTASYPADAGVLVYDGDAPPDKGQIIFFAFAYSDLSDRDVARQLLENAVAYLIDETSGLVWSQDTSFRPGIVAILPNPFTHRSRLSYFLPARQHVDAAVYDVRGRLVRALVGGVEEAGLHTVEWEGRGEGPEPVSPGVYFFRLVTTGVSQTSKIVKID
jgi:hypothetical protein